MDDIVDGLGEVGESVGTVVGEGPGVDGESMDGCDGDDGETWSSAVETGGGDCGGEDAVESNKRRRTERAGWDGGEDSIGALGGSLSETLY